MLTDPNIDSPANIDAAVRSTRMLQLAPLLTFSILRNLLVLVFIDS
jgi:hypothetical protein